MGHRKFDGASILINSDDSSKHGGISGNLYIYYKGDLHGKKSNFD